MGLDCHSIFTYMEVRYITLLHYRYRIHEDVQRKTLGNIDFKGSKMKGNFKYSRFNDLEQQIQIESHKINVECIFVNQAVCSRKLENADKVYCIRCQA